MLRLTSRTLLAAGPCLRTLSTTVGGLKSYVTSTSEPRKWRRPLEIGVLPAYDEALAYIEKDAAAKREKLEALQKVNDGSVSREDLIKLEIESEINLPQIRWEFENGQMDLRKPVFRHLLNQQWRTKGRLDRLMERIHQMHVAPDVVPTIRPAVDIKVSFAVSATQRTSTPRIPVPEKKWATDLSDVVPGLFISPAKTIEPPKITAQAFHPEPRLYTLVMIDPDVPSTATPSFQNYLHWLIPNISLSATSNNILPTTESPSSVPYIPPHPQNGTPYHRYVLLLLPQKETLNLIGSEITRLGFDIRSFASQHYLQIAHDDGRSDAGGIFMWRGIWDSSVSDIYENILKRPEPRYGRPPKFDPYVDENGQRAQKYIKTPPHISVSASQPTPTHARPIENVDVMDNHSPASAPIP